jgi:heme/copper-type cytochrome/quinol oxidase subunit 1
MGENKTPDEHSSPRPSRLRGAVLPIAALAVVLAGCFIAWSNRQDASFGWFAYAPLDNEPFSGSGLALVTQGTQIGLAVAVVGLLLLAFWAGYRIGRKAGPKSP